MSRPERVRVVRLLVYEGTPEWVRDAMARRGLKEKMIVGNGSITEGWLTGRAEEVVYSEPPPDDNRIDRE